MKNRRAAAALAEYGNGHPSTCYPPGVPARVCGLGIETTRSVKYNGPAVDSIAEYKDLVSDGLDSALTRVPPRSVVPTVQGMHDLENRTDPLGAHQRAGDFEFGSVVEQFGERKRQEAEACSSFKVGNKSKYKRQCLIDWRGSNTSTWILLQGHNTGAVEGHVRAESV